MTDKIITSILEAVFSIPSIFVHTIWFILWFVFKQDVGLLTNIVSLEAIYIGIFVGYQQLGHHEIIKEHIKRKK